ncbi:MAG: hypothetical protein WD696_20735 [Bryobacteraceae bacterium]
MHLPALFLFLLAATPTFAKAPLLLIAAVDPAPWRAMAAASGWRVAAIEQVAAADPSVSALVNAITPEDDQDRIYLVGPADAVAYAVSRAPDRWAAAVILGGALRKAVNSNRLFGINAQAVPILWLGPEDPLLSRLAEAGYRFQRRQDATGEDVLGWLEQQRREPFPVSVDCETGSPAFARCFWLEMTKFDPSRRNDAVPSTRVHPGSGASLDLGPFGFDPKLTVVWLPDGYKGPLKLQDRIVSIGGRKIKDGREYAEFMDSIAEAKVVAVGIERGKRRLRLEARIVLPKREEVVTARAQGTYLPDLKELQFISRAVVEMKVHVPEHWAGSTLSWNGVEMGKAGLAGCWLLNSEKEPVARTCP